MDYGLSVRVNRKYTRFAFLLLFTLLCFGSVIYYRRVPANAEIPHHFEVNGPPSGALGNWASAQLSYRVHAFYYGWYNAPQADSGPTTKRHWVHWNHAPITSSFFKYSVFRSQRRHVPPQDIASSFYPKLGPYSSFDPNVIHSHMHMARFAGIGVLALSWYPAGMSDDNGEPVDDLVLILLNIANTYGIKICLHVEPYRNRNVDTVRDNLRYARDRGYTTHPAYYRLPPRQSSTKPSVGTTLPVFFFYDSYDISPELWSTLLLPDTSDTIRSKEYDAYLIGLLLNHVDCTSMAKAGFDGGYTYFAGQGTSEASYYALWSSLGRLCRTSGLHFYPSIGPGYNDTTIRTWNARSTVDRQHGKRYASMFSNAMEASPNGIGITSFNEWHEGSQVEPATRAMRLRSPYRDYTPYSPEFYLRVTRMFVNEYEKKSGLVNVSLPAAFFDAIGDSERQQLSLLRPSR